MLLKKRLVGKWFFHQRENNSFDMDAIKPAPTFGQEPREPNLFYPSCYSVNTLQNGEEKQGSINDPDLLNRLGIQQLQPLLQQRDKPNLIIFFEKPSQQVFSCPLMESAWQQH